jgi:nucleoside-diphosphate-sugar epimerase
MRAFVTGSTGLPGNNLVRTLLQAGHEVVALARSASKGTRELGDTSARIVIGDMARVAEFADALAGVDVVFHTAAYFREYYAPGDHARIVDRINVDATMELARAAHSHGVAKMVDTSSSGIVGMESDGSPGNEQTPPSPLTETNLYFRSKSKVKPLLRQFSREKGFFIASVLPAWMWGPHDAGPTASGQITLDAVRHALPPAIPPGGCSVVDARDVAAGMLRVAEVGRSGERYIPLSPGGKPPKVRIPFAVDDGARRACRNLVALDPQTDASVYRRNPPSLRPRRSGNWASRSGHLKTRSTIAWHGPNRSSLEGGQCCPQPPFEAACTLSHATRHTAGLLKTNA